MHRPWTLSVALVVLAGLVGACSTTSAAPETAQDAVPESAAGAAEAAGRAAAVVSSTVGAPTSPRRPRWSVSSVTDGDTLWVTRGSQTREVRLVGVNTPERGECLADRATRALKTLVQDGPLRLVRDVSDVDRYGRSLRYVETADGTDVGAELVRRGLALARRYPPDVARAARYERLQRSARRAERGLWSPTACGGSTSDAELEIGLHPDAAGDDNVNLNDEWIQITNVGDATVDMTGWQVADESASHRYTFGSLRLRPGRSVTLFTGCGDDTDSVRHWCNRSSAVWNNDGDTVFVRDVAGNLVASRSY